MPATWEPWLHSEAPPYQQAVLLRSDSAAATPSWVWLPLGQAEMRVAAPPALEKQAPSTRRPAKKGWSVSMPVSRITTVWPWPSMPLAQTAGSPMLWVLLSRAGAAGISSWMLATCGRLARLARLAASTRKAT